MESSTLSILYHIHRSEPVTRQALKEQAGLGTSRISTLVSQLIDRRVVLEQFSQDGSPGRPVAALFLNPDIGRVVGLDIGGGYSRAVLADITGNVLATRIHHTNAVPDRNVIMANIAELIQAICDEGGIEPQTLAALGVGVRGIVDTKTGMVLAWPNTPAWTAGWLDLNVPAELSKRLRIEPAIIDDTVRGMGMTARRFGPARTTQNFLYVFLGRGIGSAIFVDGQPYRGGKGLAGELGHVMVEEKGPWCSCGNRGCLEVLASTEAVLQRVKNRLAESQFMSTLRDRYEKDELSLTALIQAAQSGDKLAFQILDETGAYVGKVLATALNLLGPELVILGGPLAQDGGIIREAVQRQVRLRALELISSRIRIVSDDQGELAGARGAAWLALDHLFSSPQHLAKLLSRIEPGR